MQKYILYAAVLFVAGWAGNKEMNPAVQVVPQPTLKTDSITTAKKQVVFPSVSLQQEGKSKSILSL